MGLKDTITTCSRALPSRLVVVVQRLEDPLDQVRQFCRGSDASGGTGKRTNRVKKTFFRNRKKVIGGKRPYPGGRTGREERGVGEFGRKVGGRGRQGRWRWRRTHRTAWKSRRRGMRRCLGFFGRALAMRRGNGRMSSVVMRRGREAVECGSGSGSVRGRRELSDSGLGGAVGLEVLP